MANNKRDHSPPPPAEKQSKKQVVEQPDVNISHSSWLYKLTSTPNSSATKLDNSSDEKEPPLEKQSEQEERTDDSTTENTPNQPEQDDHAPQHANGSTGGGIWSWLGYSGTQPVNATSVPESHPVSESAPAPVPVEEASETNQEQTTNDHKNDDSVTPQEHHHHQSKPSYWKSFFISNKSQDENQQDSVIISDKDDATEQEIPAPAPQAEQQTTPEEPQQRKAAVAPSRHNVVLPTFKSQFNKATVPYHDTSTSLFSKAINAINSIIFTQKSAIDDDWQEINRLSTMLDSLRADISSKRIVIIGVHGWFPMKVGLVTGSPSIHAY